MGWVLLSRRWVLSGWENMLRKAPRTAAGPSEVENRQEWGLAQDDRENALNSESDIQDNGLTVVPMPLLRFHAQRD